MTGLAVPHFCSLYVLQNCTPLHLACQGGKTAIVELLIVKGADVEGRSEVRQECRFPPCAVIATGFCMLAKGMRCCCDGKPFGNEFRTAAGSDTVHIPHNLAAPVGER